MPEAAIDHDLRTGHGLLETRAGEGVDADLGRGGDDLVAAWRRCWKPRRPDCRRRTVGWISHTEALLERVTAHHRLEPQRRRNTMACSAAPLVLSRSCSH